MFHFVKAVLVGYHKGSYIEIPAVGTKLNCVSRLIEIESHMNRLLFEFLLNRTGRSHIFDADSYPAIAQIFSNIIVISGIIEL